MQTILGSGGAIGTELAKALRQYTSDIRLVSRTPKQVNPTDHLHRADLTKPKEVLNAINDAAIVYLTVGLPYSTKVWQAVWPVIIKNVIDACKAQQAKLVFFDNVYMYSPDHLSLMTEETPIDPVSKKGGVRSQLVEMILDEVESGALQAIIARSADFYGPSSGGNSVLTSNVFENLSKGKKANWLGSINHPHSFTYTPDAGKGTALLGNTANAYNQVWHLPTAPNPLTGREWIEAIAEEMGVEPKYQLVPKYLMWMLGLFAPAMKETAEMMYQYERDYIFDSSKFEERFDFAPTPYLRGIQTIVKKDYQS